MGVKWRMENGQIGLYAQRSDFLAETGAVDSE